MLKGRVDFVAPLINGTVTFAAFESTPPLPQCVKVVLACTDANEIVGTVWVRGVASSEEGLRTAMLLTEVLLSRLAYSYELAVGLARTTASEFEPEVPPAGHTLFAGTGYYHLMGHAPRLLRSLDAGSIRQVLETPRPPGEKHFSDFRSARLSTGPVEEFTHLYRLLLELVGESQAAVDALIVKTEPSVPQSPSPIKPGVTETVYTRLRNELAHKRAGVDLNATKGAMAEQLHSLRQIVRAAIAK